MPRSASLTQTFSPAADTATAEVPELQSLVGKYREQTDEADVDILGGTTTAPVPGEAPEPAENEAGAPPAAAAAAEGAAPEAINPKAAARSAVEAEPTPHGTDTPSGVAPAVVMHVTKATLKCGL